MRDNGPIFVRDAEGRVALVDFGFNGWGEPTQPTGFDARVPELIASHLGARRYVAPLVLEGGSFFVDGAGTLIRRSSACCTRTAIPAFTGRESSRRSPRTSASTPSSGSARGTTRTSRPTGTSTTSRTSWRRAA